MKQLVAIAAVFAVALACSTQKTGVAMSSKPTSGDTVRIANDSLQYEVIVIDPGFSSWLAGHAFPRHYYSQSYLESKNRIWVSEWNNRAHNPLQYRDLYDMTIDYDPTIDYGYEVNYLIYNYLVYFQNKYRQRLGGNVPER
jgi:hypothetical protein